MVSQPSRGLESHAACLDCSLKCDAEMGLGAAWGPGSSGDKWIDTAVPGGNEGQGLMPTLKALGGIYVPVHISAPCISSPTTSSIIGQV